MNPQDFEKKLQQTAKEIQNYTNNRYPSIAGNIAVRFVNGNFKAQGFQGQNFERWKKSKKKNGTTLVDKGHLRAATFYTTQLGQTTLKNNAPWAKVHNEGFQGTVTIKAHSRNKYKKAKKGTGKFTKKGKERTQTVTYKSGNSQVREHQRKINIPKRQFMPTNSNDSPVLNNAIIREISKDIKQIIEQL